MADLIHASFDGSNAATSFAGADGRSWSAFSGAALSTTSPKYGSASASFPQVAGASFRSLADPGPAISTGDFTIEFWVWLNATLTPSSHAPRVFSSQNSFLAASDNFTVSLGESSDTPRLSFAYGTAAGGSGSVSINLVTMPTGQWIHLAISRASGTIRYFKNGALLTSNSIGWDLAAIQYATIGGTDYLGQGGSGLYLNGRIDDFRISDFARYTAAFTPSGPNSYTAPSTPVPLAAAGIAVSSGTATPNVNVPLSASGLVQATGSGQLLLTISLNATGVATALGTANLALSKLLAASGAAFASGTATPVLEGSINLAGAGQVEATGGAILSLIVDLGAQALNQALGAGALSIGAPLAANGSADATGAAELAKTLDLAGAGQAQATGDVSLWLNIPLSAQALAQASGSAEISLQILMDAAGVVQAVGAGTLSQEIQLLADGQVVASGQATLQVFAGIAGVTGMLVKPEPREWHVARPVRGWHARPASRSWRVRPVARDWNPQEGVT